jgi:hypothetical protein
VGFIRAEELVVHMVEVVIHPDQPGKEKMDNPNRIDDRTCGFTVSL